MAGSIWPKIRKEIDRTAAVAMRPDCRGGGSVNLPSPALQCWWDPVLGAFLLLVAEVAKVAEEAREQSGRWSRATRRPA